MGKHTFRSQDGFTQTQYADARLGSELIQVPGSFFTPVCRGSDTQIAPPYSMRQFALRLVPRL